MEVSAALNSPATSNLNAASAFGVSTGFNGYDRADALVLASIQEDTTSVGTSSSAARDTFQQMVSRLNELLKKQLPDGIESLDPEQATPDATADRIVTGIEGLFGTYADAHPELSPEELVTSFMEQARAGVERGYSDAVGTLKEIGAYEVSGVSEGIAQTKTLLGTGLESLEKRLRDQLGIGAEAPVATITNTGVLQQSGQTLLGRAV